MHACPVQVSQNQSAQTQRVKRAHPLLEAPHLFLSSLSLTVQLLQGQELIWPNMELVSHMRRQARITQVLTSMQKPTTREASI